MTDQPLFYALLSPAQLMTIVFLLTALLWALILSVVAELRKPHGDHHAQTKTNRP